MRAIEDRNRHINKNTAAIIVAKEYVKSGIKVEDVDYRAVSIYLAES